MPDLRGYPSLRRCPSLRGWTVRPRDVPDLTRALVTVAVVECGLRLLPLPRLARMLGTPLAFEPSRSDTRPDGPKPIALAAARRVLATRRVLRHWPFGDTCLRQALASGHLLRRLGPTLHVGVSKAEGEVRAHAWIVVAGTVIDPLGAAQGYRTLVTPAPKKVGTGGSA